jgi:ribose-phosphate pyrophosphokinase
MENGASDVSAVAPHAVFSGPAISRIAEGPFKKVMVTDSIPLGENEEAQRCEKIQVVSMAPMLAEAIKRVHSHDSVSSLFT